MLDAIRLGRDRFRFWRISLLMGILSITAGIWRLLIPLPVVTAILVYLIGLSFVLCGLFRFVLAFHLRRINRTMKQFDDEVIDAEVIDAG